MAENVHWNRCDDCGRFIAIEDFASGKATRRLLTPSAEGFRETYATACPQHADEDWPSTTEAE